MAQTTRASSVPDRVASTAARRVPNDRSPSERMPNTADYRFADSRAGNGNRHRFFGRPTIVYRVAGRSLLLRRVAARRRLARIDPEAVERRAWRLIGGVRSPMRL
jgi:hypothetical protein